MDLANRPEKDEPDQDELHFDRRHQSGTKHLEHARRDVRPPLIMTSAKFEAFLRGIRPDLRHRGANGSVLIFRQFPLFVGVSHLLDDSLLWASIDASAGHYVDGNASPPVSDDDQTTRLETAIISSCGEGLLMTELLVIDLMQPYGGGIEQISLLLAETRFGAFLTVSDSALVPNYSTFAFGPRVALMELLRAGPELILPRLRLDRRVADVMIRCVIISAEDANQMVCALTGESSPHLCSKQNHLRTT